MTPRGAYWAKMYLALAISVPAFAALGWVVRWIATNQTGTFAEGVMLGLFGALSIAVFARWEEETKKFNEILRGDSDSPDRPPE